jgi:hypothetical protein
MLFYSQKLQEASEKFRNLATRKWGICDPESTGSKP